MRTTALGELCEINVGRTPARAEPSFWGDGHPWLSIADMNQGSTITRTKEHITDLATRSGRIVRPGTVLLSFKLSIGKVGISAVPLYTNEAIAALPIKDEQKLDSRYLLRALEAMRLADGANRAAMGATLNKKSLAQIRVPVLSLPEQRRIATILDQADAIRAKRRQVLAHLNSLGQSIFRSTIGSAGWPVENLGERLEFLTSGSRGWARYYAPRGDKFIRIQNVKYGYLSHHDMAFVVAPATAEAKRTAVRPGDVLLSITADLGRTAVVPEDIGDAYINQHLAILRAPSLDPRYLADFLTSPAGQREVLGKDRGATKAGLNFDDIRSVAIPIPPKEVQQGYAAIVARLDIHRDAVQRALAADDELFSSLQSRAFRGEL